jgi:hypothetical protein
VGLKSGFLWRRLSPGATVTDGLCGPVPCGTGFPGGLGNPTQDGWKRCPVGYRSRFQARSP